MDYMKTCVMCGGEILIKIGPQESGWCEHRLLIDPVKYGECVSCGDIVYSSATANLMLGIAKAIAESGIKEMPKVVRLEM